MHERSDEGGGSGYPPLPLAAPLAGHEHLGPAADSRHQPQLPPYRTRSQELPWAGGIPPSPYIAPLSTDPINFVHWTPPVQASGPALQRERPNSLPENPLPLQYVQPRRFSDQTPAAPSSPRLLPLPAPPNFPPPHFTQTATVPPIHSPVPPNHHGNDAEMARTRAARESAKATSSKESTLPLSPAPSTFDKHSLSSTTTLDANSDTVKAPMVPQPLTSVPGTTAPPLARTLRKTLSRHAAEVAALPTSEAVTVLPYTTESFAVATWHMLPAVTATQSSPLTSIPTPRRFLRSSTPVKPVQVAAAPLHPSPGPIVHEANIPQRELSQHPKAIASRAYRAKRVAGLALHSPERNLPAARTTFSNQSPAMEVVLSVASVEIASNAGKRAAEGVLDRLATAKRARIVEDVSLDNENQDMPDMLDTATSSTDSIPAPLKFKNGMSTEKALQDIHHFSKPGEDLDWTKVDDKQKRREMQNVISRRKANDKKRMQKEAQKEEVKRLEGTLRQKSQEQRQRLQRAVELPSRMTRQDAPNATANVNAFEESETEAISIPAAVRDLVAARFPEPIYHIASGRLVSPFSLADIIKYSGMGEDLDWTKVRDKRERARMQGIISKRKAKDPNALYWMGRADHEVIGVGQRCDTGVKEGNVALESRHDLDVGQQVVPERVEPELVRLSEAALYDDEAPLTLRNSRVHPQTLRDISKYSLEGENLAWYKERDPIKRREMQNLIYKRKKQDPGAVKCFQTAQKNLEGPSNEDNGHTATELPPLNVNAEPDAENDQDSNAESEEVGAGNEILHPATGRVVSAKSMASIKKYQRQGADLDWTKMEDSEARKVAQNVIQKRKRADERDRNLPMNDHRLSEVEQLLGTGEALDSLLTHRARPRRLAKPTTCVPSSFGLSDDEDEEVKDHEVAESGQVLFVDAGDATVMGPFDVPATNPELYHEGLADEYFVAKMKEALHARSNGKHSFYARQCRRILELLDSAKLPSNGEALFPITGDRAAKFLNANHYFPGPMIVHGQQPAPLSTVDDFLGEVYDDSVMVDVQDPSLQVNRRKPHVRSMSMAQVKRRFGQPVQSTPLNCLELATHYEDGLRPQFLNGEDCRLLNRIKLPSHGETASRVGYTAGWKEVEKWALLAQAGALTEPHQDSHGYSTYITVNQGIVGFGWLANPSAEERGAWGAAHDTYVGDKWRYVILRPGMTVYFPAGTVHFVFRHPDAGSTLAFGGHVLRCSQIVRWVNVLLDQQQNPDITNEDIGVNIVGYLGRVEKYVKQAVKKGEVEKWGGQESIDEFLKLKARFMGYQDRIEKRASKKKGRR